MLASALSFVVAANEKGFGGEGDDPSGAGGVLIIVGITLLLVLVVVAVGLLLRSRAGRRRPDVGHDQTHDPGRVGRL